MMYNQNNGPVSKQEHEQLKSDLQNILADTIKKVDRFDSIDNIGAALGMAKIA